MKFFKIMVLLFTFIFCFNSYAVDYDLKINKDKNFRSNIHFFLNDISNEDIEQLKNEILKDAENIANTNISKFSIYRTYTLNCFKISIQINKKTTKNNHSVIILTLKKIDRIRQNIENINEVKYL